MPNETAATGTTELESAEIDSAELADGAPPADEGSSDGDMSALDAFASRGLAPDRGLTDPGASSSAKGAPQTVPVIQREIQGSAIKPGRAELLKKVTDPTMAARLKNMSNDAFDYFYKEVLRMQNGELLDKTAAEKLAEERVAATKAEFEAQKKEALSTRYSDHELGYKLVPEYQQLEQQSEQINWENEFWSDQLQAFRANEPVAILQVDPATGKVSVTQAQYTLENTPRLEGYLLGKISQAQTIAHQLRGKLAEFPVQHKGAFEKFHGSITKIDKELFGSVKSPAFHSRADQLLKEFPKALQGRTEIALIAKMRAAGEILEGEIGRLQAELAQAKQVNGAKAAKAGAPDPSTAVPGPGDGDEATNERAALDRLHQMSGRL